MSSSSNGGNAGVGPHAALLAVQVFFGTWPLFGKVALRALPSTGLVALRVGGAALAFLALRRLVAGRGDGARARDMSRRDFAHIFLYSLLGVTVNQLLYVKGLALSTAVNATILSTAIPVFALVVSVLLGYERFSARKALGTLVAACGVVYLVDPFGADFSSGRTVGNFLLVANTLAYGAYIAVSQDMFRRHGALNVITWVFVFGSLVCVPFGAFQLAETPLGRLGWTTWLAVAYIIAVPTVAAYYLNAWALARVAPSTVAAYVYLQPLIIFAVAPLALGPEESWGLGTLAATALIVAGVALVTRPPGAREAGGRAETGGV